MKNLEGQARAGDHSEDEEENRSSPLRRGTFLAVASAQFCPVKVCSVGTSVIIFIVGVLLWSRGEEGSLERFFESRKKLKAKPFEIAEEPEAEVRMEENI